MSTNTHTRNFRRRSRNLARLESSEKASALEGPEGITQLALNTRSASVGLSAHAAFIHHFGWRPDGDGLRQTKPNKSPLRQFIKTEKLNITINRVILVNTFLSLDSLQLSISIEQLLLGLPPLRILLQREYPIPSVQVLSSTSKLVFVDFFGSLPLNEKLNLSAKT